MEQKSIDASLGLAFALDLLKQHQQMGELRGIISTVQFLRTKRYQCIIQIENGQVISCSLIDEQSQERPANTNYLIQVDEKGGPFDWKFYPHEEVISSSLSVQVPNQPLETSRSIQTNSPVVKDNAVPVRLTSELQLSWLTTWQESEIRFLQQVFSLVNGQRTVHNIKSLMFRSSPEMIEKALVFLIAMKQIEIQKISGT